MNILIGLAFVLTMASFFTKIIRSADFSDSMSDVVEQRIKGVDLSFKGERNIDVRILSKEASMGFGNIILLESYKVSISSPTKKNMFFKGDLGQLDFFNSKFKSLGEITIESAESSVTLQSFDFSVKDKVSYLVVNLNKNKKLSLSGILENSDLGLGVKNGYGELKGDNYKTRFKSDSVFLSTKNNKKTPNVRFKNLKVEVPNGEVSAPSSQITGVKDGFLLEGKLTMKYNNDTQINLKKIIFNTKTKGIIFDNSEMFFEEKKDKQK